MTVRITSLPEPAAPPVPDGGLGALSTEKGNLPLDSVDVHAAVSGLAASVTVVQGFRNPYDVPLEATYVFPLPDRAAVTSLRMEAADRVVDGVLKERGQARQEYDTAIASGRRAAIAEEDRPDVFTMRVGNILPGERVTVRLVLNQPLPFEATSTARDALHGTAGTSGGPGTSQASPGGSEASRASAGEATFRFPLVVAPRYIPGAALDGAPAGSGVAADTDAVPDASRITPPVLLPGFPNPVALSLTVEIDPAALPLSEIRSALHVVAEESSDAGGGDRVTVRLRPGERLNRDFILRLVYGTPAAGDASLTLTPDAEGDEGTFTFTVLPSTETRPARPRDVVLVLDRSYSMQGWKMVAARRAAARIVDTFTPDDRFAVMSFDNTVEFPPALGAALAAGTDRNRFRAVEYLATVNARGGTEMLEPLEQAAALLHQPGSGRDRVLLLVTDGQVGNEDQILDHLAPALRDVRVHTVGIDRAVNAGFLNRLASVGGGHVELVESEDRLDEAMERVHHRVGAPLLTDLSLRPDGLEFIADTIAPKRLGSIFPGVPLVVTGRYRGEPSGTIVLHGRAPDGSPREHRAQAVRTDAPMAAALWARAHLRDLEDSYAAHGSLALEQRIVATSLRFGVLCRFTAFVAIDTRVATEGQTPHRVTQPVELPDGWDQSAGYGSAAPDSLLTSRAVPAASAGLPPQSAPPSPSAPPTPFAPSAPPPPSPPPAPGAPRVVPAARRARPARPSGPSRGSSRRDAYAGLDDDRYLVEDDLDVPDFLKAGPPASTPPSPAPTPRAEGTGQGGSGGSASAVPSAGTQPTSEPPLPDASALTWPWNTLKEELDRMEAVHAADHRAHLVGTTLPILSAILTDGRALTPQTREILTQTVKELELLRDDTAARSLAEERADQLVIDVWSRTLSTLKKLLTHQPPPPSRPSFWKRSR
ncbi:VIT domain-containing protein [Actinomadura gamaensis]|uniref:VIT domain-containing protein n=1 Tax=Actinomadura gamaensis TaxID=1763541 RepID=A0ABV9U6Q5_9ACTN